MSEGLNQEYALARWREDAAKDDPPFYTVQPRHGRPFVWMNVGGNIGWYAPELNNTGEVVGLRGEAWPQPGAAEDDETRRILNWQFKLISPKQRRKLAQLLANNALAA
jgi:hypothetical protein